MIRIFGPPGTGKTTTLIAEADKYLEHGNPERIAYVSFSRKAANEARNRITEPHEGKKHSYTADDLPHFKTLHALCYRVLGVRQDEMMQRKHYRMLGNWLGIDIGGAVNEFGMPVGDKLGDKCLRIVHLARNRLVPLREQWEATPDDVAWHEVERFSRALEQWKQRKRMYDFTDLLEQFSGAMAPELDMLIVDEAQDLTPLQWKVANILADGTPDVFIAGDDDQAVYHWAGADVSLLIDGPGEARVLNHSYRLPRAIFDVAASIASKIHKRVPKVWEPHKEHGEVKHVASVSDLPLENGTWYLLGRNKYLLQAFTDELRERGLLYTTQQGPSVPMETIVAIRAWTALQQGKAIPAKWRLADDPDVLHTPIAYIYDLLTAGYGYKRGMPRNVADIEGEVTLAMLREQYGLLADGPWFDALTRITQRDVLYLRACLRHGEKLSASRIHVSTIHGVKGGEAEHVAIIPDMSFKTWEGYLREPDHELRVFYVAVTRASKTLTWIDPQGNRAMVV